jgi:tetratricopeptide (TPR) repeat protein
MASRLDEIRLETAAVKDGHFDLARAAPAYQEEFRRYGLDVEELDPQEVADRIAASVIRDRLVSALDDWMEKKAIEGHPIRERLLDIAQQADADPWRRRFRDALCRKDKQALQDLARNPEMLAQPPATVCFLARVLKQFHDVRLAVEVLRQAQQRYPNDFWINQNLAFHLTELNPPASVEALGFFRAAVALRPESPGVHVNLGRVLDRQGQFPEAEAEYREAIRLKPDYEQAHSNLASLLRRRGRLPEAEAEYREALRHNPQWGSAHYGLGCLFLAQRKWAEAEAEFSEDAILRPGAGGAYMGLGDTYRLQGKLSEAEAEYRRAIRVRGDAVDAHYFLGKVLLDQAKLPQAIAAYHQALRFRSDHLLAHHDLCDAYARLGQWDNAAAACARTVELNPGNHWYWYEYAVLRFQVADTEGYRRACREMFDRFGKTDQPEIARRVAKACLLMPESVNDPGRVQELLSKSGSGADDANFLWIKALADYRAGRYATADAILRSVDVREGAASHDAEMFTLRAMVQHRLGMADEARAALASARSVLANNGPDQANWWDWLHARIHYREAVALMNGKNSDKPAGADRSPQPGE